MLREANKFPVLPRWYVSPGSSRARCLRHLSASTAVPAHTPTRTSSLKWDSLKCIIPQFCLAVINWPNVSYIWRVHKNQLAPFKEENPHWICGTPRKKKKKMSKWIACKLVRRAHCNLRVSLKRALQQLAPLAKWFTDLSLKSHQGNRHHAEKWPFGSIPEKPLKALCSSSLRGSICVYRVSHSHTVCARKVSWRSWINYQWSPCTLYKGSTIRGSLRAAAI